MLDYARFISFSVSRFQHEQVKILRDSRPEWFVTHNGLMANIDYRGLFSKDLDFLGYDVYPMFCSDHINRPHNHAFGLDGMRALSGNFIIPEHQSGPGGQEPYFHDNPEPGEVRAMTYRSVARGCDGILYFRWRTCRFGAEEYWCGILDHDNVPRRRYDEISQIGKEMKQVGTAVLGTSVYVDCAVANGELDIHAAHYTYPMGLPSPSQMASVAHKYLFEKGFSVGCVHPEDDLSGLKLYIVPQWVNFNPAWVPSLERFVKGGGVLVIGARTATKDISNNVIPDTIPGCLRDLAGITVEEYGKINRPEQRPFSFSFKNKKIPAEIWHEVINPEKADIFAKWSGRHLDGKTAATIRKLGKGHVVYVGTYISENVLGLIGDEIAKLAKLKPIWAVPKGVESVLRYNEHKKIWFFINDTDSKMKLPRTPKGLDLISGRKNAGGAMTLERYGTAVIKEENN